uniref:Uncharacterized protein n=1 Tax=Ananas comosus var. bracteatus TaxID=296719 RepID=A0A6V7QM58_ANACO|nr:unnamed protein product [Ananas comosus var. bracteatus]
MRVEAMEGMILVGGGTGITEKNEGKEGDRDKEKGGRGEKNEDSEIEARLSGWTDEFEGEPSPSAAAVADVDRGKGIARKIPIYTVGLLASPGKGVIRGVTS